MNQRKTRAGTAAALCLAFASAFIDPAEAQEKRTSITDIVVSGNTLLPQSAIDSAIAPFRGERTAAELKRAAAAVQALYRDAGYGAVVAFVPEQSLSGGRLQISVLEGRVSRVVVFGNRQFSAENVRRSVPSLLEGQTPRIKAIDADVQMANENPARLLAVTLEEGQRPGEVDARVAVTEDPVSRYIFSLDNTGNKQTGRLRLGAAYQNASLWDRDHQLTAQIQVSPDKLSAVDIVSVSYRVPFYKAGLTMLAYATVSNVDGGSTATAAGALQFNGKGRVLGLQGTRVLQRLGEFEQRVSLAVDQRVFINNCAIEGLPPGACGAAGESVTIHPLTLGYDTKRPGDRAANLSVALSVNLALGGPHGSEADFEAARPGAPRRYSVLRASGGMVIPVARDWLVNLRATAQSTSNPLVAGEQFGLASTGVVRGYQEREIVADSGAAASVELVFPALFVPPLGDDPAAFNGVRFLGFFDTGFAKNSDSATCNGSRTRCTLSAIGVGARFTVSGSQWKVDLAQALDTARETKRGDIKLHFSARYVFP